MAVVRDLFFYPIKSFRGLRSSSLHLDEAGPRYDRQWMLVDSERGFLTQRQIPQLARIGVSLDPESSIELSYPGRGATDFGLEEREGAEMAVKIWKDEVLAHEVSADVSRWLSAVLDRPVRLVRLSDGARRGFDPELPTRTVRFVDSRPLLVISVASLKQLELKAGVSVSMSRFRPNIVVDDVLPHAEDEWGGFTLNGIRFKGLKPCTRCKITTLHPLTGAIGEEPLKTLATYRRGEKGIVFGYHYAHLSEGVIHVGGEISK